MEPRVSLLLCAGRRSNKTLQHAMMLLGHELLEAGDAPAAERLLTAVAGGWALSLISAAWSSCFSFGCFCLSPYRPCRHAQVCRMLSS